VFAEAGMVSAFFTFRQIYSGNFGMRDLK
jgi:hypothetical protein